MPAKKTTSNSNTKSPAKRAAGKASASKGTAKKDTGKAKALGRTQAAQSSTSSKYDQPGAPWWKKIPLPIPK